MTVTIYHNPRCSKSRATLELLRDNGVDPEIVEYMDNPPSAGELKRILGLLGKKPADILRRKEAKEEGIDAGSLSDDELVERMVAAPRTIERPIVIKEDAIKGGRAALGRPPESVLEIL